MKVLILQGLPASGKSTYAKSLCNTAGNKWKRVNKDLLREMVDCSYWDEHREKYICKLRDHLIKTYLIDGYNVVVDDTNFSKKHINRIKEVVSQVEEDFPIMEIETEVKFIDTPVFECIERDKNREKSVGQKVILDMYKKYLRHQTESIAFKEDKDLPPCIICDIDGTLAYSPDRNVYDYTKVDRDIPNTKLIKILQTFRNTTFKPELIIVSGREDNCREETENWLKKNNISYDKLYMRRTGDNRNDSIIKKEIYDENINNKYNIVCVFDDRPRVIRMWKHEGLFVLDCNRQDSRIDF